MKFPRNDDLRSRGFVLCLIFQMSLFPAQLTASDTLSVCAHCEITTISQAIELSQAGDVIEIQEGLYQEGNIVIDKSVQLVGIEWPVVDGKHETEIFTVRADSVSIRGLEIRNVGTSYTEDRAAIRVENSKGCEIIGNRLYDTFFGIYLAHVSGSKIIDNEIIGSAMDEMSSANAIHLWYCKDILIQDNIAQYHRDGIYLEFVDDSRIRNNRSEHNLRYGLHFMFSNNDDYDNNTFLDNGAGVAVMFSHYINMRGNTFKHNWGTNSYGLLLKEIYDGEITGNEFSQNTIGIYGEGTNRLQISANTFSQNGWALKILGSCMDNVISGNNFLSNTFDLATNSPRNHNQYTGNYWSEYAGYDLDRDGIGDVPHRPVKLYSYVVSEVPPAIILLRSFFVDLINFAEKIIPVLTPESLTDESPAIRQIPI